MSNHGKWPLGVKDLPSSWSYFYLTFRSLHSLPWMCILKLVLGRPSPVATAVAGLRNAFPVVCMFSPPQLCISCGTSSPCFGSLKSSVGGPFIHTVLIKTSIPLQAQGGWLTSSSKMEGLVGSGDKNRVPSYF